MKKYVIIAAIMSILTTSLLAQTDSSFSKFWKPVPEIMK